MIHDGARPRRPAPPGFQGAGIAAAVCVAMLAGLARAGEEPDKTGWVYLDNGTIRLGVKTASGAAIGSLARSGSTRNLLNDFDRGRLVQQSYYGNPDGSVWVDKPWRWNPVQGGDYKGGASTVLELQREPTRLFARVRPRNWAGCVDLPEATMEERITLDGPIVHVHPTLRYSGATRHGRAQQEIPAVFTAPDLDTLVLYDGKTPWTGDRLSRSKPGWPNESRHMTEHWAAYVDKDDFGVGAYVPVADVLTCYRYGHDRPGAVDACSYFAPLTEFAITPGLVFEYDLYLAVGTSAEIRAAFQKIRAARLKPATEKPDAPRPERQ